MATLSFNEDSNGCSLPPFNLVSNSLFFFRINVFEMELPLESESPDDGSTATVASGGLPFDKARLGLPIADLFPRLLAEFSPKLLAPAAGGGSKIRLHAG